MKGLRLFSFVLLCEFIPVVVAFAQKADSIFVLWPAATLAAANTAQHETYLSDEEKQVILLCNLARTDGAKFVDIFLKEKPTAKTEIAVKALIKKLLEQKNLPPLVSIFALHRSAYTHACDMARTGKTGYNSSTGQPFYDRIHQFYPAANSFAESYYAGGHAPLEIVMALLIDASDSLATNRSNLLSPTLQLIGVSSVPHKYFCANTVIDMARKPPVRVENSKTKKSKAYAYLKECPKSTKVIVRRKKFLGIF